jgi:1,2-diacylglycerol 3-alpha-glucosyltransferase
MKIALVSTGLGRVLRGFESFTESLFQALMDNVPEMDVTLFQGGGKAGQRRHVVPNFHRSDVPARWLGNEKGNLLENRSFALSLYPLLRRGKFNIVHYNELVMGSALFHLRRIFGGDFKLLYCNGAPSPPVHYHHRCDYAQVLTGPAFEEAQSFGISRDRLFLIPYGINGERFSPQSKKGRNEVRKELDIPLDAEVILTVAALKREHKRLDYLIKELGSFHRAIWLVAAGQRTNDTPVLQKMADKHLSGRWRFISWPHDKISALYGSADIFVLPSLSEAFGLVTVEAMLTGLMVILHNGPVFKWVTEGTNAILTDMTIEGNMKNALERLFNSSENSDSREIIAKRFSWQTLVPEYVRMYKRIAEA